MAIRAVVALGLALCCTAGTEVAGRQGAARRISQTAGQDYGLALSPTQYFQVKTGTAAAGEASVEFYLRLDNCGVQSIVAQRLQLMKKQLPYTLRQELPETAQALDGALVKMASEQTLTPGVQALRGAAIYKRSANDSRLAAEVNDASKYKLDKAVHIAQEGDTAFAKNFSNSSKVEIEAEPPLAGRGIMVDPQGDVVFWSRDEIGVWRGVSAIKCSEIQGSWHHVSMVQQQSRLLAYVDGEYKGRVTMTGNQGGQYLPTWTFGDFGDGPSFPMTGAIDNVKIWGRSLQAAEVICGLRGSVVSSSKILALFRLDEGKGTSIAGMGAVATIQLRSGAEKSEWVPGAMGAGAAAPPAAPPLPEERSCAAVEKEMRLADPARPPPVNELHIDAAVGSCPGACSGHGRCNYQTGTCFCFTGFIGTSCDTKNYPGYALEFDPTFEQRLELLPLGKFRSFTISMWVKPATSDGWATLLHYIAPDPEVEPRPKGTMALELEDGAVRFLVNGNAPNQLRFKTELRAHRWQLLTLAYSMEHKGRAGTGAASVYLDGLLKETLTFDQSGPVFLGGGWFGGQKPFGRYFGGLVDELRFYARTLNPMDVIVETSGRAKGTAVGLQAYYRFDEGSGRIAVDLALDADAGAADDGEEGAAAQSKAKAAAELPTRFDALLAPSEHPPTWVPSSAPMLPCKGEPPCNGRGRCVKGACECINGWTGDTCKVAACPNACSGHGLCVELDASGGAAALEAVGIDVDALAMTIREKVGGSLGSVLMPPLQHVIDDAVKAASAKDNVVVEGGDKMVNMTNTLLAQVIADVLSSGDVKKGRCICEPPYAPPSCASEKCPNDCSGHGLCNAGACVCEEGFTGTDCSELVCTPEPDCSNHGSCIEGTCVCNAGWDGDGCEIRETCPNDCTGHGACGRGGICKCDPKYTGKDCAWSQNCFNFCSGRGDCVMDKCVCNPLFTGPDCSQVACPGDCTGHGDCVNGTCLCETGFTGDDCSQSALWPLRCVTTRQGMSSSTKCIRGWSLSPSPGSKVLDLKFEDEGKPVILESKSPPSTA